MRALECRGPWAVGIVLALAAWPRPAAAQRTVYQFDGAVNVGYTQTTVGTVEIAAMPQGEDIPDGSIGGFFTEIRPGIALQTGTPRLTYRAGYQFSANLSLYDDRNVSYANTANASAAAALTKFTTSTLSASIAQGGTSFLLSQRPADAGNPELRAPGNAAQVSVSLAESIAWEAARQLTIQQTLIASGSAPQDDLGARNTALTASLSLDRGFSRDTVGVEARASISWLRPLRADEEPYRNLTNALLGRWSRDFSVGWNGFLTAGVEQVYTGTGSEPLAFLPTASAAVRYTLYNAAFALEVNHGTATNLQVGSISLTDRVTARGIVTLDPRFSRSVGFSAGFLHNEPLGESDAAVSAGTGNAVQGDAGFTTALSRYVLFSARYSLAYQFDQGGDIAPTLAHIFFAGVTASYRNTERPSRPLPTRGRRVDASDAEGFPIVDGPQ